MEGLTLESQTESHSKQTYVCLGIWKLEEAFIVVNLDELALEDFRRIPRNVHRRLDGDNDRSLQQG